LNNEARRHQLTEVLALVQDQMADIAAVQRRQAELTAEASVADGLVVVTVNAHGHVIDTQIDETYLDEYEFEELSTHITDAARAAVQSAAAQVAEMMAPLADRRRLLPSLSDVVDGAPDLRDLVPPAIETFATPHGEYDTHDGGHESALPSVRR
jgi:DNA-binding protein YbaB